MGVQLGKAVRMPRLPVLVHDAVFENINRLSTAATPGGHEGAVAGGRRQHARAIGSPTKGGTATKRTRSSPVHGAHLEADGHRTTCKQGGACVTAGAEQATACTAPPPTRNVPRLPQNNHVTSRGIGTHLVFRRPSEHSVHSANAYVPTMLQKQTTQPCRLPSTGVGGTGAGR